MTLKECYAAMGGDYEGAMSRLRSEKLLAKFVLKFPEDTNFETLRAAMAVGDQETAFRAAHTIKGLCLNLGFIKLGESSSELTEALRKTIGPEAEALLDRVAADYSDASKAIAGLDI